MTSQRTSGICGAVVVCAAALVPGNVAVAEQEARGAGLPVEVDSISDGIEARRAKLLAMLTSPKMLEGDIDSGGYSYRRRWQHYHACLAKGVRLDEANEYFAQSDELAADEWPVLLYLRTYFAFKETVLSETARK